MVASTLAGKAQISVATPRSKFLYGLTDRSKTPNSTTNITDEVMSARLNVTCR